MSPLPSFRGVNALFRVEFSSSRLPPRAVLGTSEDRILLALCYREFEGSSVSGGYSDEDDDNIDERPDRVTPSNRHQNKGSNRSAACGI